MLLIGHIAIATYIGRPLIYSEFQELSNFDLKELMVSIATNAT